MDIDPRADLSGGLVLIHGMNIVIGHEVRSLGRLTIYHGTTLGGNFGKRRNILGIETGQPVLDDNVIVGPGSSVLGPVYVGKNVIIGANAVVTRDVPQSTIVVGNNRYIEK